MRPLLIILAHLGAFLPVSVSADSITNSTLEFHFRRENVLGTSFDLTVCAPQEAQATRAEDVALTEIERLRRIFSTYDSSSEIGRINASHTPTPSSPELIELLGIYELWMKRSAGAYSAQTALLTHAWREGEKKGAVPSTNALAEISKAISSKSWSVDGIAKTITRTNENLINLDSAGKGYIIGKVVEAIRRQVPEVSGLLLNIGGDIQTWGQKTNGKPAWRVRVADPRQPAQNGKILTELQVENASVSTSGDYARGFNIAGKRYSHILDPRTGQPAMGIASATVIAKDSVTGNALATSLCVLNPADGLKLTSALRDVECLIVATDGTQYRSPGFTKFESQTTTNTSPVSNWPAGYGVTLELNLKVIPNAKRPYVAVWVENDREQPIRNITLWAGKRRYIDSLTTWYGISELNNDKATSAITRATRRAGNYTVEWDGTDNEGKPVPKGDYTIFLEVAREHGTHATKSVSIKCGDTSAKAVIGATPEFDDCPVQFGPLQKVP